MIDQTPEKHAQDQHQEDPISEPAKPIPALFASIRGAPGEIERMNELLAKRHRIDTAFYEAALTILRAAEPWAEKANRTIYKKWAPRPTTVGSPWAARLDAYQFGNVGAKATTLQFETFNQGLLDGDGEMRRAIVAQIFSWGRVSPRTLWTLDMVDAVTRVARDPLALTSKVPWSSSWTKVAAAATHDVDLGPSTSLTQVIWDSRVSFAIADGRISSGQRAKRLQAKGWKFASGTWTSRADAFWRSQNNGSRLVQTMAMVLNSNDEFADERQNHGRWTSFDVALALFVEGY